MKEQRIIFKIKKDNNGTTICKYLQTYKVNTKFINNLINNRKITLNGVIVERNDVFVYEGDVVYICVPFDSLKPYKKNVDILYEDEWIIVVNKPAGILVHSDGVTDETLMNAVYFYLLQSKQECCAYPIHRLDYETTGIVVFAKNKLALSFLSVEIEKHQVEKEYVCLCEGKFSNTQGVINNCIGKDRHSNKQMVVANGKEAETYYKVLKNGNLSKVRVKIKHGRKHQIRVHLSYIKHPIVGDQIYGNKSGQNLKLHFYKVSFVHPYTREKMIISCKENF